MRFHWASSSLFWNDVFVVVLSFSSVVGLGASNVDARRDASCL